MFGFNLFGIRHLDEFIKFNEPGANEFNICNYVPSTLIGIELDKLLAASRNYLTIVNRYLCTC